MALAAHLGRDLQEEMVEVVSLGGATNVGRFLGTRSGRKSIYARLLIQVLDLGKYDPVVQPSSCARATWAGSQRWLNACARLNTSWASCSQVIAMPPCSWTVSDATWSRASEQ